MISKRILTTGLALAVIAGIGLSMMQAPGFLPGSGGPIVGPAQAQSSLGSAGLPQGERPVVVELYTSQGCSSCPPADAFLGELSDVEGVLALSFHVDYWDYIGWKDTFADPAHTDRQRRYREALDLNYVYTPQMVIDGAFDAAGFRKRQVFAAVEKALAYQRSVPIGIEDEGRLVKVAAGEAPAGGATLYLAMFDEERPVAIKRGENSGREMIYHNVVRDYRKLGQWTGEALEIALDPAWAEGRDGCAVILQEGTSGRIIGAAMIPLQEG